MAYKRQSPLPIVEGGTNTSSLTNTDGVIYFDGTKFNTTTVGTAGQVLTSNGPASAPTFQSASGAGTISVISTQALTLIGANNTNNWCIPYSQTGSHSGVTQTQSQFPMPVSGTLSNMFVYVTPRSTAGPCSVILNKNMVNTALSVSLPNAAIGLFSNTVNSVAVSAGDLIQFECNAPGGGSAVEGMITMQLTT